MPSEEAAVVNEMARAVDFAHLSLAEQRDAVDRGAAELPSGVTITPVDRHRSRRSHDHRPPRRRFLPRIAGQQPARRRAARRGRGC